MQFQLNINWNRYIFTLHRAADERQQKIVCIPLQSTPKQQSINYFSTAWHLNSKQRKKMQFFAFQLNAYSKIINLCFVSRKKTFNLTNKREKCNGIKWLKSFGKAHWQWIYLHLMCGQPAWKTEQQSTVKILTSIISCTSSCNSINFHAWHSAKTQSNCAKFLQTPNPNGQRKQQARTRLTLFASLISDKLHIITRFVCS